MANLYDLKKFDLNLLVIFESIYQHQSISKAAETLFITPSAVSQSLQRLRAQLNDPLFVRSGKGVTPTTVGINLHAHLEENLNDLERTINIMNNSELMKTIVVYSPQILVSNGMVGLINRLRETAQYNIVHHDIFIAPETAEDLLNYRKADLVLSLLPVTNRSIVCTRYRTDPLVLVCSNAHPRINDATSASALLEEGFTAFSTPAQGTKEIFTSIEKVLPQRKILFRSDSFISVLNMISNTDLVGIIPLKSFNYYKGSLNLKQINAGITLPTIDVFMMYNRASMNSTVFAQLVESIDQDQ